MVLKQSEIATELASGSGHSLQVKCKTGFGSAVESFYLHVGMTFQDRGLNQNIPLWVEDDGTSRTPYLKSRRGLLIRPLPEGALRDAACQQFKFLGQMMGHAFMDGFTIPLPLAEEVFKLLVGQTLGANSLPHPGAGLVGEMLGALADFAHHLAKGQREGKGDEWRKEQASLPDFARRYLSTGPTDTDSRAEAEPYGQQLSLDDYLKLMGVSFLETGLSGTALCPGGDDVPVTVENLEDFLQKVTTFWFDTGVRAQARPKN